MNALPENNHLYVDDLGCVFIPNINKKYRDQLVEIQDTINQDLIKLQQYATEWHQPVHNFKYIGSLTENECKSYMASANINKQLQAVFSCPRKWRFNYKKQISNDMKYYLVKTG
ncbi:unnamed protein product [Rotaria socialis]|uniref:Uncharacterized protein n=1 Tax=Rotaria socialis TaxID=392032 RepID=A0A817UUD6_9BILA|nr:unnamed protein product [Rotaria socialis]